MNLMSDIAFKWFITFLTGGLAATWFVYDSINLLRLRGADRRDPLVRDKRFGYLMGLVIGAVGIIGCLRFHGVM
jgi:hypothetical protein